MHFLVNLALKARGSLNKPHDYGYIDKITMGEKIPKVVHQTYSSKNLPELVKKNIEKLKANNPDWQFRLYDDDDRKSYIAENYPKLLTLYHKINPEYGAARADFFRYLVIYKEGGVYLDIKSGADKRLTEIVRDSDKYLLSHWPRHYPKIMHGQHPGITNPIGELQQWHVISVSGHPFLKLVIENVCHNIQHYNPILHDYGSWGVFNLTGPIAYTEPIYPLIDKYPNRLENNHEDLGLIYVALETNNNLSGHHQVFEKPHYSKLEESITSQPLYILILFSLSKPLIKFIKKLKRVK